MLPIDPNNHAPAWLRPLIHDMTRLYRLGCVANPEVCSMFGEALARLEVEAIPTPHVEIVNSRLLRAVWTNAERTVAMDVRASGVTFRSGDGRFNFQGRAGQGGWIEQARQAIGWVHPTLAGGIIPEKFLEGI